MTDFRMAPSPGLVLEQARATGLVSSEARTPSPVIPFPDYVDMMRSPFIKSDVLSNRFGDGHDLPSAFREEVVIQLAEIGRGKPRLAEVRQEQGRLAHISEEISSTPYYPLQPLSIWQHPTKGIGRYRSGYVKLPPGSYNNWITSNRDGKTGQEKEESIQGAAVLRVDRLQMASTLTSAAASMGAVDPEHSTAQGEPRRPSTGSEQRSDHVHPPAASYSIRMQYEGDESMSEAARPRPDRIRLAVDLISAGGSVR